MSQLAQTLLNMSVLEDVLREVVTNLIQQKCTYISVVDLFNMNNTECATPTVLPFFKLHCTHNYGHNCNQTKLTSKLI